jgi:uncharacterized protein YraI
MKKALALGVVVWLMIGGLVAQTGVTAVVVNEYANIRIVPAIGAEVIATVPAGYLFDVITARTGDNIWLRIDFNGEEGWVHTSTLSVLTGDAAVLPVADPRSIPFGGVEVPRSGLTEATSDILARATDWLRVRAGPSTGYPVLANAPIDTLMPLLGRTESSSWIQVNYEGTLGWVSSRYLQLPLGFGFAALPVGGIIASAPIESAASGENYLEVLKLMQSRIDLAQPSLDQIRASWTDAALTGRAACNQAYPVRPSDYNIPNPILAAFYDQLNPLVGLFNDAMFNVRYAIDLFIDACEQPGPVNTVGQALVVGALDTVALADAQFAELRRKLNELIPPPVEPGLDQCIFTFANQVDILPVIPLGQIITDGFTPRNVASGYCVDLVEGQSVVVEILQFPGSNLEMLFSISPIDNPTGFLATNRSDATVPRQIAGPVPIPATGRYIIILSHTALEPPQGEFGLLVSDALTAVPGGTLQVDAVTGDLIQVMPTANPLLPTAIPAGGGVCPSPNLNCFQLQSIVGANCALAQACLTPANAAILDPDGDGVPCEQILCPETS